MSSPQVFRPAGFDASIGENQKMITDMVSLSPIEGVKTSFLVKTIYLGDLKARNRPLRNSQMMDDNPFWLDAVPQRDGGDA
jgi:hypothetical protein